MRELSRKVDVFLVIGSTNSSNSNRLKELAKQQGVPAYLIDGKADIKLQWFDNVNAIGVTAGASAPEILVKNVMDCHEDKSNATVYRDDEQTESVRFQLPKELRNI